MYLLLLFLLPLTAIGQATFAGGSANADLLTELESVGLTLSNPTLENGDRNTQVGIFSNGLAGANFQIDTGVVLTTGSVTQAFGANGTNAFPNNNGTQASTDATTGTYNDADIVAINATANNDVVVFSFDVDLDPTYSGVSIIYQFGSEEYPDYVGSVFNDIFGFFVSGPGITGTENIATVPGTSNPVAVNTVNAGFLGCNQDGTTTDLTQGAQYINNGHDPNAAACNTNSGAFSVTTEYNGITQAFTSTITGLSDTGTYRFKIAIADTGDSALDSAVFIDQLFGIQECSITSITAANISACNDNGTSADTSDDFFTADITVNYVNPDGEGLLLLSGDGAASIPVGALGSATSHTFSNVQLPADGGAIELTANFSDDSSCTFTNSNVTTAPSSCSSDIDTDGDGVLDSQEIIDGTDENDQCDFVLANQSVTPSAAWGTADCDGDGIDNDTEVNTDGTDPLNDCDSVGGTPLGTSDCDGDGVTNAQEATDGTDPDDQCDFVLANQSVTPSAAWGTADCDGDGIDNDTEVNTDSTDPLNDCDSVGGTPR
ncbi:choice-of-anchor L domain-containing protein, partial [Croceivirga thetidis]|uniref:choice-of-anchor L domain-containing protein n=1 Tax=Croceivirga thetidis TaxID=2721623 RepID=UPI001B2FF0EC